MVHLKQPPGGTAAVQVSVKVRVTPVLPPAVRAKLYSKLSSSLPMPGMLRLLLVPTLMLLVADQLTVSCGAGRQGATQWAAGKADATQWAAGKGAAQSAAGQRCKAARGGGRAVPKVVALRQHCWAGEAGCSHSQLGAPTVLETEICLLHVTVRLVAELLHTAVSPTMLSGGMAGLMT